MKPSMNESSSSAHVSRNASSRATSSMMSPPPSPPNQYLQVHRELGDGSPDPENAALLAQNVLDPGVVAEFRAQLYRPEAMYVERDHTPDAAPFYKVGSQVFRQLSSHPIIRLHEAVRDHRVHGQKPVMTHASERSFSETKPVRSMRSTESRRSTACICQWRATVEAHGHLVEENSCSLRLEEL